MALSNAEKLVNLGFPTEQAKLLQTMIEQAITAAVAAITPADIEGFDEAVEEAVAAKTEIAALTGSSTAANIVTALQA